MGDKDDVARRSGRTNRIKELFFFVFFVFFVFSSPSIDRLQISDLDVR